LWQQDGAVGGVLEQPDLGEFRVEGLKQQEVTVGNPWKQLTLLIFVGKHCS